MRLSTLTLALCFAGGCGADDKAAAEKVGGEIEHGPAKDTVATKDMAPPEPAPVHYAGGQLTTVRSAKDMPYCELTKNGNVVYIQATREFKTCDATTGEWYDLDVKGPKGDKGDQGAEGAKGDTGAAGPAGVAGAKGEKGDVGAQGAQGPQGSQGNAGTSGADGRTATDSMWHDPISLKWWTYSTTVVTLAEAQAACVSGWRLPTPLEWRIAHRRGLGVIVGATVEAWLSDGTHARGDGVTNVATAATHCVQE